MGMSKENLYGDAGALRVNVTTTLLQPLACSRRSDSGTKASERAGKKKRGETGGEDEGTPVKLILKSPCRPL